MSEPAVKTDDHVAYQPSARDQELERLADARNARVEAELSAAGDQVVQDEPASTDPVAPTVEDQVTKQMRKVKVDGEELEVSEDDLVASYQKQAAATKRLQEAGQMKEQAERILAEAKAQAAQMATPAKPAEPEPDRAEKIKAYHQALFEGDQETASRLFDEVAQGRQAPIPDMNQIVSQATSVVKQQLDNESALDKFTKDYSEIVDDPYLVNVTKQHMEANMAAGKPYAEALMAAGEQTRDWLKSKVPASQGESTTTTRAEKLEKKGRIDNIRTTSAIAATQEEPEENTSAVIMQMRKARGLG